MSAPNGTERHWDQIAAFAVRQVAMREMHQASRNAAATLPTPESTDDAFREVTEELTALRDLYEEAPLAYVKEDLQSRFISANRAAQRILGIKPEEVPGIVGLALVPDDEKTKEPVHVVPRLNSRLSPGANVLLLTVVRLFHGLVDDPLPSEAAAQFT